MPRCLQISLSRPPVAGSLAFAFEFVGLTIEFYRVRFDAKAWIRPAPPYRIVISGSDKLP